MRSSRTVRRSLAEGLIRLGAGVFPLGRQEWAAAMRAELFQIGDDGEAMHWALGCFFTGLRERCRLVALLNLRVVRWAIAAWIMYQAGGNLCSSLLVLSYKLRYLGLTQFLSQCNEVKDYHSLVPLIDATALWEPGLCVAAVMLYLLGIVAVLRRSQSAYMLFIPALVADVGLWLYELTKPLFAEVYSPVEFRHDAILYAVTALLVTALWQEMRSRQVLTP
jgi:hypothetical protein